MPTETAATWPCNGFATERALLDQRVDGVGQRDETAGDRCRARTAVGLQHVAVDGDGALAQSLQINHRAQGAADQALNLLRAAGLLAARGLARRAGVRGPRQHAVFGGDPALSGAAQERRHAVLDTGGAQHPRRAESDQHGAFGVLRCSRERSSRRAIHRAARPLGRRLMPPANAAPRRWCCRCTERTPRPPGSRAPSMNLARVYPPPARSARNPDRGGWPTARRCTATSTSPRFETPARRNAHFGQRRVAAETAFDVVAHRVAVHFRLGDQALAQQHLDVAVVARALQHLRLPQLINAAVAHVRPIGRRILHQAHRAGCARARFDAKPTPSLTTSSCARPSDRCRNPSGSKIGCGVCQNASSSVASAVSAARAPSAWPPIPSMTTRSTALLRGRYRYAILVFFAMADQAHIRGLDLQ